MDLKKIIREVPDFPQKGIGFKDITTMLQNADAFRFVVDSITNHFKREKITKIVSLESRGFIVGGALAYNLHAGFVPIRKSGKLPAKTISMAYELEYGIDRIEMHEDALSPDDVVLIHDDLLATGGTALAALRLVEMLNVKEIHFSFICDLAFINTSIKKIIYEYNPQILVKYDK